MSDRLTPFLPYVRIVYDRRTMKSGRPRARFEVRAMPGSMPNAARRLRLPCACCGRLMHVFRERRGEPGRGNAGPMYVALTCPLKVRMGCARSAAARDAYDELEALLV